MSSREPGKDGPAEANERQVLGVGAGNKAGKVAGHEDQNIKVATVIGHNAPCMYKEAAQTIAL